MEKDWTQEKANVAIYSDWKRIFTHKKKMYIIVEKVHLTSRKPRYLLMKEGKPVTELPALDQLQETFSKMLFEKATALADAFIAEAEEREAGSGGR